jgi:hypothetical protein
MKNKCKKSKCLKKESCSLYLDKLKELYPDCVYDNKLLLDKIGDDETYGEMEYEGVKKFNNFLNNNNDFEYFLDIGSGRGKICCWYAAQKGIKKSIGIEIVKERHDDAIHLLSELKNNYEHITKKIYFMNNSIFDINLQNIFDDKILIWMSNLCFSKELTNMIFQKLDDELPKESLIVCSEKPNIELKKIKITNLELYVPMSWNPAGALVYIYHVSV